MHRPPGWHADLGEVRTSQAGVRRVKEVAAEPAPAVDVLLLLH